MRVFINSILRARRFKYDCETGRKNHGEPLHHAVYIYIADFKISIYTLRTHVLPSSVRWHGSCNLLYI